MPHLMYDTQYECRYCRDDIFLESDGASEAEQEFVLDILYREDFLNVFGLSKEGDADAEFDTLMDMLHQLFVRVMGHPGLVEVMNLAAAKFLSEDAETGLCVLYSYDYLHLTHTCVSSFLETGEIQASDLSALRTKVVGHEQTTNEPAFETKN